MRKKYTKSDKTTTKSGSSKTSKRKTYSEPPGDLAYARWYKTYLIKTFLSFGITVSAVLYFVKKFITDPAKKEEENHNNRIKKIIVDKALEDLQNAKTPGEKKRAETVLNQANNLFK
jgi:hypothetical protein